MGYWKIFPVNHGGTIILGANSSGIYFSVLVPFRPFHRPFLVPFEDISAEISDRFLFKIVTLRAAKNPNVSIKVAMKLANWIEANSSGTWRLEKSSEAFAS